MIINNKIIKQSYKYMIILVWYGMSWYGMALYGTRRWDPRALWVPRAAPRAIPCHTIPYRAIPYQYYHILILLHYYLIIYYHLVILLYDLYCIICCAKMRPKQIPCGGRLNKYANNIRNYVELLQ